MLNLLYSCRFNSIVFIVSLYFSKLYVDNLDRFLPFFCKQFTAQTSRNELKKFCEVSVDVCACVLIKDFFQIFRVFTTLIIRNASK